MYVFLNSSQIQQSESLSSKLPWRNIPSPPIAHLSPHPSKKKKNKTNKKKGEKQHEEDFEFSVSYPWKKSVG